MKTEAEARQAVIDEAMSWVGTPYMSNARVKGLNGGVDCLTFVAGVYENAGVIDRLPIPHYPPDWHLNQDAELYLIGKDDTPGMLHFCREIFTPPKPADIVLWKFGHCFAHAAIVVEWPIVIHAWAERAVACENTEQYYTLQKVHEVHELKNTPRPRRTFEVKDWRL